MVFSKVFKSVALSIVFTAVVGCMSSTNRVVHLLDEPRHRTVFQDGSLYLLDVQLNPGDESLEHLHDQAILLSKRLTANLNNKLEIVFFSDSGSVSVEIALKMSIQYWLNKGTGQPEPPLAAPLY